MRRTGYYSMGERKFPEVSVEGGWVVRFYGHSDKVITFLPAFSLLDALRGHILCACFFTCRSARPTTSGGLVFLLHVFTCRSTLLATSGGPIFLCLKKDRGERQTKGLQSRPLESCFYTGVRRGDVRRPYEFALVQLTRFRPVRGVLRTASTDSVVLLHLRRIRWHLENNRPDL